MNALMDSPIEALALSYLSYAVSTAVNSIWPWLAVITAAVGFWRIRTNPSPPPPEAAAAEPPRVSDSVERTTSFGAVESDGSPKGKFSVYFTRDDGESDDGGGAAVEEREELGLAEWCGEWERVNVGVRMGDLGWYRFQDLRVLDGSVVRLWDGRRRSGAAAAALVAEGGRFVR